jgi:class 3 adenylate cyclase/tetratricopeptide (TPR) repeat protein
MELMEDLDPEEARAIIDPALQLMMDAVHHYGSHVAQSTGDGVFALFGAPIAHEDHPQRALYAALKLQADLGSYAERLQREGRAPLSIRVGINTGEVVVRSVAKDAEHSDYLPVGHSTGLAERMEGIAKPGSILVTEHTHRLTEGYFLFRALGPTRVKGLSGPIDVFEVIGIGPLRTRLQVSARRGLSKFVGRQAEMDQLKRALELARSGHGQIVAAVGEPGVGKSRLFHEFKLSSATGWLVLEAFSVSHAKASAYLPVIDLLKNYFEISSLDDDRKRREKVTGKVLALDRSLEDALPFLFSVLAITERGAGVGQEAGLAAPMAAIDQQETRQRTLEAFKRLLIRESLNQPLIIVFEDLHWIDEESQTFLTALVESLATARVLLLLNYRPEYRHDWSSRSCYTQLRLDPLGKETAFEMLAALLGDGLELEPVKKLIAEKTEGNPFFMEEIVQQLLDEGALVRNGVVKLARQIAEIRIPPTAQAVLAARIDRLEPEAKALLQKLSVIGKEVSLPLISKIADQPSERLGALLAKLQAGEFIYEQPAFPDVQYIFKHALTQEVAYNSVLSQPRKDLHRATAAALEVLHKDRLEDYYDELAHHYSRAGAQSEAVSYLLLAARKAAERFAFEQALSQAGSALELLKSSPANDERTRRELDLQIVIGGASIGVYSAAAEQSGAAWHRALELCRQSGGDPKLLAVILFGLYRFHRFRGEFGRARELAEEALAVAERVAEPLSQANARFALGTSQFFSGDFARAGQTFRLALGLTDIDPKPAAGILFNTRPLALAFVCHTLMHLGFHDQARNAKRQAISAGREPAWVITFTAEADVLLRDQVSMLESLERLAAIDAARPLNAYMSGRRNLLRGWLLVEQGQAREGVLLIREALATISSTGTRYSAAFSSALMAQACARAGELDEAFAALDRAFHFSEAGELFYLPELHRIRGEFLLIRGETALMPAETCFRKAIEVARSQQAKFLELRATMSLARLLAKQDKRDEARTILSEIYNWFTEGFDTADLKDAKALLEVLGA